ncbi:MAG: hypothetical protein AAF564_05635 [Bacteroidota bacterium]
MQRFYSFSPSLLFALLLAVTLFLLLPQTAEAQFADRNLSSERKPIVISMQGVYESVPLASGRLSETSLPFALSAPMGRYVTFGLQTRSAIAQSDVSPTLSGLNDVYTSLQYARQFNWSSLAVTMGINIPSGQEQLSLDELETAIQISQPIFGFHTPGFGQGFNVRPTVTWAFPVFKSLVIGLVAQRSWQGTFKPIAGMTMPYDPGDEWMAGIGLDSRILPHVTLSADASFSRYSGDYIGETQVFEAGMRKAFNVMFRYARGHDDLRLLFSHTNNEKGTAFVSDEPAQLAVQTVPSISEAMLQYKWRISRPLFMGVRFGIQQFEASTLYDVHKLAYLSILPMYQINNQLAVLLRATGTAGDFYAYELGTGITVSF